MDIIADVNVTLPEDVYVWYHCMNISTEHATLHVRVEPHDDRQYLVIAQLGDFPRLESDDLMMGLAPRNMAGLEKNILVTFYT